MKKALLTIALSLTFCSSFSQVNDGIIDLAKAYRQFMLRNIPPQSFLDGLKKYDKSDLEFTAHFIRETITPNSNLLADKFLVRPNMKDLKYINIVKLINYNIRKDDPKDNNQLINELLKKNITDYELIDSYYSMLFISYGNKVTPYDMSGVNFDLNKYNLKDDTEKGIFFLQSMSLNGTFIWGYMNIVKPPNYVEALSYISKYPKYNDLPYYQYLDFSFPDFKMNIESEKSKQSYKEYYLNKYYDTLLSHLLCLNNLDRGDKEINDLILGSILKERNYYKYSKKEKELNKLLSVYKK